jgi:Raf kinase inhibitor-like YbhB/YbcL family protein
MRRPARTAIAIVVTAVVGLIVTACRNDGRELDEPTFPLPAPTTTTQPPSATFGSTVPPPVLGLTLLAPWQDGATVPTRYTCDDLNLSPALTWSNVPVDAVELALTVTDLDAANFAHWVVVGIDPTSSGTTEGEAPVNARVWTNSFGDSGWGGPCPPPGDPPHTYLFTVHALNQPFVPADDASAADVVELLNQLAVAQSSVSGTYTRTG